MTYQNRPRKVLGHTLEFYDFPKVEDGHEPGTAYGYILNGKDYTEFDSTNYPDFETIEDAAIFALAELAQIDKRPAQLLLRELRNEKIITDENAIRHIRFAYDF